MIYAKKKNVKEEEFIVLLEETKKSLIKFVAKRKDISPTYFETVVFEQMVKVAKGGPFDGTIYQTGTNAFPDIVAKKYFGVEVKMTTSDHWTSTGNSVLESSRVEDVERIYIMFGKFGGGFDVKYRLYQECLPEISVTHYPRYRINMNLSQGQSIFDKMGVDYDTLRKNGNTINTVKEYYRARLKEGEELWWIDPGQDKDVSPIIKSHKNLSDKEKENFIVEAMIYFPEMFSNSGAKFERAAAYLITEYNAVSANLRDIFTAGGQVEIKVKRKKEQVSRIYHNMVIHSKAIKKTINTLDEEKLKHYWRIERLGKNRLLAWKKMIDEKSPDDLPFIASDIFNSGL
ncbi:hypothetical protein KAR28_06455 [Candidatus Parcubacteria bacterium]|nr:hypothetical protein [Candidatus Parcubacteria bacterium]